MRTIILHAPIHESWAHKAHNNSSMHSPIDRARKKIRHITKQMYSRITANPFDEKYIRSIEETENFQERRGVFTAIENIHDLEKRER